MNFGLSEEQQMVQQMAREFAQNEIAPYVEQDEENHYYRREILTKMGELGLLGWSIPEEYGGNGMGWMEAVTALYEIAKVHTSWRLSIMLNNTRMGCATGAAALSAACLEGAVQYANERMQFGQPIGRFQMIQQQIAEMKLEDEAAKYLVYRAAWLKSLQMR